MKFIKKLLKIVVIEILIISLVVTIIVLKRNRLELKRDLGYGSKTTSQNDQVKDSNNKLYLQIEAALLDGNKQVELNNFSILKSADEIFALLEQVTNTNPEIMYYKGAQYSLGKLKIDYWRSREDLKANQEEIRIIRDRFIRENIDPSMTDYEKLLLVHDYIVNNSRYDNREAEGQVLPAEAYTTYGTLALGLSVCEGYAKSMKYLLDEVGIESMIVIGQSKGENHAWNLVKLEDDYYHVDATWNDPVTDDGRDLLRYNYFNLDDEDLAKTHTWEREAYPPARGKKYNYFSYNNLIANNMDDFTAIVEKALLKNEASVAIKVQGVKNINLNKILEGIVLKNKGLINLSAYSYSIDEEHGIIYIEFIK